MAIRITYFILSILCALMLSACAQKATEVIPSTQVKDLNTLPQDAMFYINTKSAKPAQDKPDGKALAALKADYLQKHFSVWKEKPNPNKNDVFWIKPSLLKTPGFGEHLQANTPAYTKDILDSMQIESYPSRADKAIITTTTSVRAVPTNKPMFNKPSGYPFDRWQNSLIFIGTPVLITHTSKDKSWLHIQSGFVYGWVESEHVATLTEQQIKDIKGFKDYVTPVIDKIPFYDARGDFATLGRIGQIFPIASPHKAKQKTLIIYKRMPDGSAKEEKIYAPESAMQTFPIALKDTYIAQSINAMIGQRYGWGGLLENRDCSALVRDIFTQYGIYLPRNSKAQAFYGKNNVDLSKFSRTEKEAFIIANATPYHTLLWQSGHIMLYIGHYKGKALIAHSAWSVMSGKYENMLGGVVITTLYVGDEHNGSFHKSPLLIDKIEAMSDMSLLAQKLQKGK